MTKRINAFMKRPLKAMKRGGSMTVKVVKYLTRTQKV